MHIDYNDIVIVVGNYGSGKTEVAVNLAVNRRRAGMEVRIADLDLVNPYFRTREARVQLRRLGIDVVLPPEQYLQADLPILSPAIAGMIRRPSRLTLLDVGGDDVGAMVLASLADAFAGQKWRMIQVVNPFRPFTDTVEGCLKVRDKIESAAKLAITGVIGNANMLEETAVEDVYQGYAFVEAFSQASGLPLTFITVASELLPLMDSSRFACPLLTINRQLVPPWQKAASLT